MTNIVKLTATALALLGAASAQIAAPAPAPATRAPLTTTTTLNRVTTVTENGKAVERLAPAAQVSPGDLLQFTVKYTNNIKLPINDIKAPLAIPANTTYVSQKCDTNAVTLYTIDKQVLDKSGLVSNVSSMKFGPLPLKKTVTVKENGVDVKKTVDATPADYTAVRWNLPSLGAGKTYTCTLRVRVN